jgi:MarR family transcriptional regulator, 2-MHQ and catechol-resistance regulon repressor
MVGPLPLLDECLLEQILPHQYFSCQVSWSRLARMSEALEDPRLTVAGLLAETWAGFAGRITAQLGEHGLADVEFEVLLRLARSPGGMLRMSDLAAQTSLTSSGITRLIDRLVLVSSVQRRACTTDRRTTYAEITDKGRARLEAALPGHLELIERWLVGPLPSDELAVFVASLRTLRDGVRPCAVAGAKSRPGMAAPEAAPLAASTTLD